MHFRLSTIEPGSQRHTYLANDAKLLDYLRQRYKDVEYEQVKTFVRTTKGESHLELRDRFGRDTFIRRMEYGW